MRGVQLLTDLSNEQCEKVVGGAGIGAEPNLSAGFAGWFGGFRNHADGDQGLLKAGKAPGDLTAGASGNNIIVPA